MQVCKLLFVNKQLFLSSKNMMPKKHRFQNTNLMKTNTDTQNAKVTVQYIQNTPIFQKAENDHRSDTGHVASHEDLEIENVEYLDENAHVEDYIEDTDEKEDNFYPNAIHCLLDLYKNKYHGLMTENADANVAQLWRDIAKDMQESFFEFNEHQIQLKYALLREQYFRLHTKEEIENFDYFEQLHEIYKDKTIENIMRGYNNTKVRSPYYKNEIILQSGQLEINEAEVHEFKSEEIVHKEHEFIDMVEKELQAMEGGVQIDGIVETSKNDKEKQEHVESNSPNKLKSILNEFEPQRSSKRPRLDPMFCGKPGERKTSNEYIEINDSEVSNGFSLYLYNQQQERRHREKMSLFEKSLEIQERALEQQQELLRELIKRLPS